MESLDFIVIAVGILGFGLVSKKIEHSPFSAPMFFVALGLLVSPKVLGVLHVDFSHAGIHLLAELTLVLVLFTDASRIDLKRLKKEHDIPMRLLSLGMPLTLIFGTLIAYFLFRGELPFWSCAVMAAILAPTDAALGQAVVSNKRVPIRIRQALNVESGLNDGIALPVILFLLCAAGAVQHAPGNLGASYWLIFTLKQIGLGVLVGVGLGYYGGKTIDVMSRRKWMSHVFQDLSAIGLSLLSYALAEVLGGNGFIAAFCAGLALGNFSRHICTCLYEFAEAEGQLLALLTFLFFGAAILPEVLGHVDLMVLLYAVLSLTVIRMLPVSLSLLGLGLKRQTHGFLGWFGPRGLASILFTILVLEKTSLVGKGKIETLVMTTVFLSIFLHGLSAYPLAKIYGGFINRLNKSQGEKKQVSSMPLRIS